MRVSDEGVEISKKRAFFWVAKFIVADEFAGAACENHKKVAVVDFEGRFELGSVPPPAATLP